MPEVVHFAPGESPHLNAWRDAARSVGLTCVVADPLEHADASGTTWILDLSSADGRLGREALAASGVLARALLLHGEPDGPDARALRDAGAIDVVPPGAPNGGVLQALRRVAVLEAEVERRRRAMHKLNQIGYALSEVTDLDELLRLILAGARDLLHADSGSIYLIEHGADGAPDQLYFAQAQNDSMTYDFQSARLELSTKSIAGYVGITGETLRITDVYKLPADAPYGFYRGFDEKTGYRTISMLVVPMRNRDREVIGVIQLMNRTRRRGVRIRNSDTALREVIPFDEANAEIAESLASQAAVAIENARLYQEVQTLFDGFVGASVAAIEARDPTTGGHSGRVATLCVATAQRVSELAGPFAGTTFDADEITELRYAALLHDFGKIGVREHVLVKANKLYDHELQAIIDRFHLASERLRAEFAERTAAILREQGMVDGAADLAALETERQRRLAAIQDDLEFLREVNKPYGLGEEAADRLRALGGAPMPGADHGLLLPEELRRLSIPRGSLDESERLEIESHVTQTYRYLAKIPWTRKMSNVPVIAYGHHEKLDGSGYPRGITGEEIPTQTKIMTVADIFDALTASDRPYKKAMPVEKALHILHLEEKDGHIDADLLALFESEKLWRATLPDA